MAVYFWCCHKVLDWCCYSSTWLLCTSTLHWFLKGKESRKAGQRNLQTWLFSSSRSIWV